ncbi:hypothetical protein Dvina_48230 [Dactylosporangium vinaceum]|uniref:Uncharacterized protein n=1 Tax=Dactylosporangium vinaceum TaxID=53362 RepID=A0ABV5MNU4_9ACTN|nr:hypothetical protein [Dactylosporangium vinaceum]UAB95701.1 hypothetical protein Dvina_48230 [Dactylosporangium vinaceum]
MGIELSIVAGQCYASSSVNARGEDRHATSESEVELFGLGEEGLTEAVTACLGRRPDRVQIDGLLHGTHGWAPVTTTLRVASASITGVGSEPVELPLADGPRLVSTAAHVWSPNGGVVAAEDVQYAIDIPNGQRLTYEHAWGVDTVESSSIEIAEDVKTNTLLALRIDLGVRIVYDAYLSGDVAVLFRDGHEGHRVWGVDVGTVMAAGGRPNGRNFAENVRVRYLAGARVVHAGPGGQVSTVGGPGIRAGADLALIHA